MRFLLKLVAVAVISYFGSLILLPSLTSGLGLNVQPAAMTIAMGCAIGFIFWRFAIYESPEKKEARKHRDAAEIARRVSKPGIFARIGQMIGNEMSKKYTPTDTTHPCPTCGGRGKNRHAESGRESECLLCAGRGYLYK